MGKDVYLSNCKSCKRNARSEVGYIRITTILSTTVCCLIFIGQSSAQTRDPRFYSREADRNFQWPNPGDPDYRTYTFNDRRYGHYQPNGYGQKYPGQNYPNQYPPGVPQGEDRFRFDPNHPNNPQTPFPGILGGWREDLQGKQRRDSLTLPNRDVFVKTNYGQVQGFRVNIYDDPKPSSFFRPWHSTVDYIKGHCSVFLGIPYALPPTFEGRFKPPRLHRGWQLLQAVDFGPACPQHVRHVGATKGIRDMDEDCLYLNVYSPETGAGVAQKYPVMMYIHGGDFVRGASNLFPGHIMASFYDVVVVTFNYRLGALGFLSTADENSPGNYGILDQTMALRWVYDNIEFFNGDRNSITLFGPGAGAASAGLLMVAPQTRHIVTRIIAQSGSPLSDWAFIVDKYRAQNTSRVLGQVLGCSLESSWALVNCLRHGRSFYELGNADFAPHVGTFPWAPVMDLNFTFPRDDWYEGWREKDWKFLSETPEDLIRKKQFNRGIHYMTGVTTQEAAWMIAQNQTLAPYYNINEQFVDEKIKELVFRYNYTLNPRGVYDAIKYMYTFWPDPSNITRIREEYIDMMSDFLYRAPVDRMVKLMLEQKVPVYMYVMNTTVEGLKFPQWRKVPHDIERYFLTGAPFMDIEFFPAKDRLERNMWTDNDRNMSHFFMKSFTDFARYGNPSRQQILGLHYDLAYQGELRYLNINTTYNSSILMNYRQTELAFWTQYLPTVIGVLVPTYPPTTEFWWEPREPLQIAFWSMSAACLFLIVLVVVCCILWRNAKRQSDRFYDEDVFVHDVAESEREGPGGIENAHMIQNHHTHKTNPNIYEYHDSPSKSKSPTDTSSLRSPSTLTMTQTIKSGSQSSIRSGISLKESNINPTAKESNFDRNIKMDPDPKTGSGGGSIGTKNHEEKTLLGRDFSSSPSGDSIAKSNIPPVPTSRKTLKSSRTQLVEGVPQTSV